MKYEVAGDPVSGLRWTRKTTKKIAAELSALGIRVSRKTVAKLLKQMNFSLPLCANLGETLRPLKLV